MSNRAQDHSTTDGVSLPAANHVAVRTWTAQRRRSLAKLLLSGLTFAKAADRLGVPRGSVCWATARWGIGRAPAPKLQLKGRPARYREKTWDEQLTERWADRRKAA